MRFFASLLVLIALPYLASAVSLEDFKPRVQDLPEKCMTVYQQQITGCSNTDFTTRDCSEACVRGLNAIAFSVLGACGSLDLSGTNTITAFLNGQGPSSLCTNANEVLNGGGGTGSDADTTTAESTAQQMPTEAPVTTTAPETTIISSTSVVDSAPVSSSLLVDTTTEATTEATTESTTQATLVSCTISGGYPVFSDSTMEVSISTEASTASSTSFATVTSTSAKPTQVTSTSTLLMVAPGTATSSTSTEAASPSSTDADTLDGQADDNSGGGSPFNTEGNPGMSAASHTGTTASIRILGLFVALMALLR